MAQSIIQIDVQDEKFKAFAAAFEKYKASMKDLPKGWAEAGAASAKMTGATEKSFKSLLKANKDFNSSLKDGYGTMKDVAKVTGEIAGNFASMALSITKWVSLSGLMSGFGLGALASSASDVRKQAQGLGVSTGDLRASQTNFGKYLGDPSSTLSNIANIQNDLSRRQILTRLGGQDGQSASQMLPSLIQNAVKQFNQGGKSSQYAEAMGLTQVFSLEDLRRLSSLTEKELQDTIRDFQHDRQAMAVSDADSQLMQNFWIQLKRSGEELETSLIKALTPLAPIFTQLASAATKFITDLLKSDELKEALENFTAYLSSPESKQDLKDFFDAIKSISKMIMSVVNFFTGKGFAGETLGYLKNTLNPFAIIKNGSDTVKNWLTPGTAPAPHEGHIGGMPSGGKIGGMPGTISGTATGDMAISARMNNPGNLRSWGNTPIEDTHTKSGKFAHFATQEAGLKAMATQLRLYQNRDHLNTVAQIISKWSPSNENDTAASIEAISKRAGFDKNQRINLNDNETLSRLIYSMTKQENGRSNYTPEIVSKVLVNNAAGSDLVVTSNGLR